MSEAFLAIYGIFSSAEGQKYSWSSMGGYPVSYNFSALQAADDVPLGSKLSVPCPAPEKCFHSGSSEHISDCEKMTAMELRRHYPREETCHRNMLCRQAKRGAIIHPDMRDFRSFLRALGPMPARGATVDRINNGDPEYAPNKVRWADKRTQNSNKGDSLTFHDPRTNLTFSTSQLAGRLGVSSNTIRARRHRGWTDDEIINGKKRPAVLAQLAKSPPIATTQPPACAGTPRREQTRAEREFINRAEEYCKNRSEYGTEAIVADLETLNETFADAGCAVTEEQYERYFKKKWPDHRPHLDYFNPTLPHSQRNLIAKIDPEYVKRVTAKRDAQQNLRNAL